MSACCEHCRLRDLAAPPDDLVMEWPDMFPMPRWLTAATDIWVTRDRQVIPIRQLEDDHLHNIERMLERIEARRSQVDEDGAPTLFTPPPALFDRKFSAIKAEVKRRASANPNSRRRTAARLNDIDWEDRCYGADPS